MTSPAVNTTRNTATAANHRAKCNVCTGKEQQEKKKKSLLSEKKQTRQRGRGLNSPVDDSSRQMNPGLADISGLHQIYVTI